MLLNFRLVATGFTALAACAQALNMINFTTDEVGCGTPSLSLEQWTHSEEVLAQENNTTKREEAQKYRIPVHITVLAKNSTVNGGNIHESQIQQVLDQFNKFYSYGFYLDTSVDKIHRYTRPDLFDPSSGKFTGNFDDIQRQYHRGEGDYASLNLIFLFRLGDVYKYETFTQRLPNGNTWTSWSSSSGGTMGYSSLPVAELWDANNAEDLEKTDGMVVSSAIVPDLAYPGYNGSLSTFAHEFGHWVGLEHTDHSAWGKAVCDPVNDGIDDTPTHILDDNVRKTMPSCPSRNQTNTCQHLDSRFDPIYNLMVSTQFGCEVDELTDGQMKKTLEVYRKFRMPYKQRMQEKGRGVQSQGQQSPEKKPQKQQEEEWQKKKQQEEEWQKKKQQEEEWQKKKQQEEEWQKKKQQEEEWQKKKQQEEEWQKKKQQEEEWQKKKQQEEESQNEQGDWRQQQIARLQSESNKAWEDFGRDQAKYRQQLQQTGQQNVDDCFNQADQDYKQRVKSLEDWMREKYNQLQADDNGIRKYRQDLERYSQERQQWCRQRAQEEYAQSQQELNRWEKEYVESLRDYNSRVQQYIDSLYQRKQ